MISSVTQFLGQFSVIIDMKGDLGLESFKGSQRHKVRGPEQLEFSIWD